VLNSRCTHYNASRPCTHMHVESQVARVWTTFCKAADVWWILVGVTRYGAPHDEGVLDGGPRADEAAQADDRVVDGAPRAHDAAIAQDAVVHLRESVQNLIQ